MRAVLAVLLGAAFLVGACAAPARRVVSPPPQIPRTPAATPTPALPGPGLPPADVPAREGPPASPTPGPAPAPAPPAREGSGPAARPAMATAPAPARGRQIVLNFDNADIEAVIQAASEIARFNYILGPGVAGKKVTVQTAGRIPEEEVFNVLLAVLEVNGVTAIRTGNLYKIVPLTAARERALPTIIGAQTDPSRRPDEVVTQIVPIVHGQTERIATALRPFVQGGNLVVHGNLLLITDTAANIARLLQIIGVMDVEAPQDELRILVVRYAEAVELARTLNDFFAGRRVRLPAAPQPIPTPPRPGVPTPAPTPTETPERPPLILADKRTNSLIVSARRADLELITQLVGQLDIDTQANKRVFVYYVENVKAKDLAATLTEIFGKPTDVRRPERREIQPTPPPPTAPPPFAPTPGTPPPGAPAAEAEPGVVEGEVKFIADEPNNALIVTTFPRNWPLIQDTIRKLDRTPKQVLIEVLVAEVSLDDENALGLAWTLRQQRDIRIGGTTYNIGTVTRLDVGPPGPLVGTAPTLGLPTSPGLPLSGFTFFVFETDRFLGLLNLYANYGKLTVLSSPHILTSENKKAVINVSTSIPIPTQQITQVTTGTVGQAAGQAGAPFVQNIEYRDAGIVLTVTPRISEKRVVALEVKQTVNDVGPPIPPTQNPTIIKREAETSVVLQDNQTLVLGGLIQSRRSDTRTGIPALSRIPVLGFLFGKTSEEFRRTELLILITPRVIGDPTEARELYEQIRSQRPELDRGLRTHPSILKPESVPANGAPDAPPAPPVPGGPGDR